MGMDLITNILNDINLRESLIALKAENNDKLIKGNHELKNKLILLLSHEDPKVRKNAALLMGNYEDCIPYLLDAYKNDNTEYVKDAYLKSISLHDCRYYLDELKSIQLSCMNNDEVSTKHIQSQLKILNPLLLKYNARKKKVVLLKHPYVDVILTTLPYYQYVTFEHVIPLKYKPVSQGVLVRTSSVYDLQKIRVYKEMLFPIGVSLIPQNVEDIEKALRQSSLLDVLQRLYNDDSPFYYKVVDGLREKSSELTKAVSTKVFEIFGGKLLNSAENYDIEIVLKEVKQGSVNIYLKLTHFDNSRFQYRKHAIANTMHPYVAATLVQLASPYMIEDAKVLDPFAGVGTLLIEKNVVKPSHFSMGLDIFGQGIEMAKKNAKIANQNIHFVHKDTLRFTNTEPFDEIITDMPTFAQMKDQDKLADLYDRFFARIHRLVRPGGYVFLYTSEIALVRKNLRLQQGYLALEEHYDIPRGKNMFYFFIVKVK